MKTNSYRCNLCGKVLRYCWHEFKDAHDNDDSAEAQSGVGLKHSGCGGIYSVAMSQAEEHLCLGCVKGMKNFELPK